MISLHLNGMDLLVQSADRTLTLSDRRLQFLQNRRPSALHNGLHVHGRRGGRGRCDCTICHSLSLEHSDLLMQTANHFLILGKHRLDLLLEFKPECLNFSMRRC
jgi:hypothetical protein